MIQERETSAINLDLLRERDSHRYEYQGHVAKRLNTDKENNLLKREDIDIYNSENIYEIRSEEVQYQGILQTQISITTSNYSTGGGGERDRGRQRETQRDTERERLSS